MMKNYLCKWGMDAHKFFYNRILLLPALLGRSCLADVREPLWPPLWLPRIYPFYPIRQNHCQIADVRIVGTSKEPHRAIETESGNQGHMCSSPSDLAMVDLGAMSYSLAVVKVCSCDDKLNK